MNRGFNYYFREGVKCSASTLYRNKGLLKSILYFFTELVGRLTLILSFAFGLSAVRQGEQVRRDMRLDISQSFKDAGKPFSVWTYILAVCLEGLIFLAGLIIIALITFALLALGYAVGLLTDGYGDTVMLIFLIPGGVLALVYALVMALIFSPTAYIVANNPDLGVAGTLSVCFNTMKANGKITQFLNVFIPALIIIAYLAVVGVAGYFIGELLKDEVFGVLIVILWDIISFIGLALIAPIFVLASRSASNHLFADIVADTIAADKNTNGVNILECRGRKLGANQIENSLATLFDETQANSYALLDEITNSAKTSPASADDFLPAVQLGEAFEPGHKRKKKKREEEGEEPLPTVSEVLNAEDKPGEEQIVIPAAEARDTAGVEPSVEKIIQAAEKDNEEKQEAKEQTEKEVEEEKEEVKQEIKEQEKQEEKEEVKEEIKEQTEQKVKEEVKEAADELEDELEEPAEASAPEESNKGEQ